MQSKIEKYRSKRRTERSIGSYLGQSISPQALPSQEMKNKRDFLSPDARLSCNPKKIKIEKYKSDMKIKEKELPVLRKQ